MHSKAKHHNAAKTTWYISKSKIIVTWLNNMVCIKVQKLYYMAKVVVLIQMQQQRNHRVSIEL